MTSILCWAVFKTSVVEAVELHQPAISPQQIIRNSWWEASRCISRTRLGPSCTLNNLTLYPIIHSSRIAPHPWPPPLQRNMRLRQLQTSASSSKTSGSVQTSRCQTWQSNQTRAQSRLQAVWHLLCVSLITRRVSWTLSTRRFGPATRWRWTANLGAPWSHLSFKSSQSLQWEVEATSKMYLLSWIKWWVLISSTHNTESALWDRPWAELVVWCKDSKGTSTWLIHRSVGFFRRTQPITRLVAHLQSQSTRRITHLSPILKLDSSQRHFQLPSSR